MWQGRSLFQRARLESDRETRVHVDDLDAVDTLAQAIRARLVDSESSPFPVTVVCVGSDRSTGDALGPLVGSRLAREERPELKVYGTLERPVHAANLSDNLLELRAEKEAGPVLAIDACLGRAENVGTVCVKPGPLKPGAGVNKELPPVGHFHVVGVVNVGGYMEYFVLQNTRLNLVMRLADLIAASVLAACAPARQPLQRRRVAVTVER